jgi:serine phosphatase RsbU (regulator of sigma subunit)
VVLVGGDGIKKLSSSGPPVRVFCKQTFTSLQVNAAIGDSLFLYTDGLSEAQNQAGEEYGEQRIERLLSDMRGASLRQILEAVSEDVNGFSVGKLQDNRSVLLLQRG